MSWMNLAFFPVAPATHLLSNDVARRTGCHCSLSPARSPAQSVYFVSLIFRFPLLIFNHGLCHLEHRTAHARDIASILSLSHHIYPDPNLGLLWLCCLAHSTRSLAHFIPLIFYLMTHLEPSSGAHSRSLIFKLPVSFVLKRSSSAFLDILSSSFLQSSSYRVVAYHRTEQGRIIASVYIRACAISCLDTQNMHKHSTPHHVSSGVVEMEIRPRDRKECHTPQELPPSNTAACTQPEPWPPPSRPTFSVCAPPTPLRPQA
jgi:hypothetical protein